MALSRVHNWISGEVLSASDLNAEFNNLIDNAGSLITPLTQNLDFDGFSLVDLARGTASSPGLAFTGDTNTGLESPGADQVSLTAGGATAFSVVARTTGTSYVEFKRDGSINERFYPALAFGGPDDGVMSLTAGTVNLVSAGRIVLQASAYTNATNYLRVTPSQTTAAVVIDVAGADTNIPLTIDTKGTGRLTLGSADTVDVTVATAFVPASVMSPPQRHALYKENVPSAWVTFRGKVGASIYASFGVSSVVRDSNGQYTITWSRPFQQASAYLVMATAMQSTGPGLMIASVQQGGMSSTSTIIHTAAAATGTAIDADQVYVMAMGPQES